MFTFTEDFCFYTGRQFGDYLSKEEEGDKKVDMGEIKGCSPLLIM